MKSFITISILISINFLLINCANQSAPTGGPKDKTAPKLLSSQPTQEQINYTSTEIVLEFDEDITLNNIKKELIITPRTNVEYESKFKKGKAIIEFKQALDSNTTYTFTFREAIKDLTEGNVPQNLILAFSTGNYLDSMSLSGSIYDIYTNKKKKDISIALYKANDTLNIFEDAPLYLTKTNSEGEYIINNVKKGSYKIYAFNDKNNNLTLQSSSEKYGFIKDTIALDSVITGLDIPILFNNIDSLYLQSARTSGKYFLLKYNKYLTEYNISTFDTTINVNYSINEDHNELKIYNTFQNVDSLLATDSLLVTVSATDSIQNEIIDSVYIKFEETKREKDEFKYNVTASNINPMNPIFDFKVELNKPSFIHNIDSLFLFIDSMTTIPLKGNQLTPNKNQTIYTSQITFDKTLLEPKPTGDTTVTGKEKNTVIKPLLYFGKGVFQSVEQDTSVNKTSKININSTSGDTGIIKINVENSSSPYTIQLLNKKYDIIVEQKSSEVQEHKFTFDQLKAGDYIIRAMVDNNNNGTWDYGNITKNEIPENIVFYISEEGSQTISLRSNWELGPLIIKF